MERNNRLIGHGLALLTAIIWGTSFVSTKSLLTAFAPTEVIIYRFVLGYAALFVMHPKSLKFQGIKTEANFALAGLAGITLYFVCENNGLKYSLASNISVIVSTAPMFTAIAARIIFKEKLGSHFILGFILAIVGIIIIEFNGKFVLKINILGDLLGVGAAMFWAIYSVSIQKVNRFNVMELNKRVFFYALIFSIPVACVTGFELKLERFSNVEFLMNIALLGILSSAVCYITWNKSMNLIGTSKTTAYIYLIPLVTMLLSAVVLEEDITWLAAAGTVLILAGLIISEQDNITILRKKSRKK